jgi:hypothetical protein
MVKNFKNCVWLFRCVLWEMNHITGRLVCNTNKITRPFCNGLCITFLSRLYYFEYISTMIVTNCSLDVRVSKVMCSESRVGNDQRII